MRPSGALTEPLTPSHWPKPRRPWWVVAVAMVGGFLLAHATGENPVSAALGVGVVAVVIMSILTDGRTPRPDPQIARFLSEMREMGVIDRQTHARLEQELEARTGRRVPGPQPDNGPQTSPSATNVATTALPVPPPAPAEAEVSTSPEVTPVRRRMVRSKRPTRRAEGRPRGWLAPAARFWHALASDFAVQGLGSLGVLLVFTGTLGFVTFAFTEVGAGLRPAAELLLPLVLAGLAAFLYRRSATFVAMALEFLFGLVTPVMAFAAFADGSTFPPDLEREALIGVLTAISVGLASAYAGVARRRPASPLKYLVAPLGWLAVGVVGLTVEEAVSAAQMAGVTIAVAATAWLVRHGRGTIMRASERVVVPGLALAYVLTVAAAWATGWPPVPMLVAGIATVAGAEALRSRLTMPWLAQAAVVLATAVALTGAWELAWVALAAGAALLTIAERSARTEAPDAGIALLVAAATVAALSTVAEPAALMASSALITAWAHVRRARPLRAGLATATHGIAAVAPIGIVAGLGGLIGSAHALLIGSATLTAGAVIVRRLAPTDRFYGFWLPVAAVATGTASVIDLPIPSGDYLPALTLLLAAATVAVGRVAVEGVRTWLTGSLTIAAATAAAEAAAVGYDVRTTVAAAAGLALVVAATRLHGRISGHLAGIGHALAALAVGLAPTAMAAGVMGEHWLSTEGWFAVTLGAWTAGWLVEVVAAGVESPLQRVASTEQHRFLDLVQSVVLVASAPAAAAFGAAALWPSSAATAVTLTLAALAVSYAAAGTAIRSRPDLRSVIGIAALTLTTAALASGVEWLSLGSRVDQGIAAALLGSTVGTIWLVGRWMPLPWLPWYGWLAATPVPVLLALVAGLPQTAAHWVLFGWGGVTAIGALAADERRNGRRVAGTFVVEPWLMPPATIGIAAIVTGVAAGLAVPFAATWPAAIAGAAATLAVALLLRMGSVSSLSWSLALLAVASGATDAGRHVVDHPWVLATPAALTVLAAMALPRTGRPAARWDLPALVAGSAASTLAVALGALAEATASTWVPVGIALLVVGIVREWGEPSVVGAALILGAAYLASPAWFATALAVASVAAGLGATWRPHSQIPLQWTSAATGFAAAHQLLVAASASIDQQLVAMLTASALVAAGGAIATVLRRDTPWLAAWIGPWVGTSAAVLSIAGPLAAVRPAAGLLWAAASSLAVWAAALATAATVLRLDLLRAAAIGFGLAAFGTAGAALEMGSNDWVVALSALAVVLTLTMLTGWVTGKLDSQWIPFLGWAAAITQTVALAPAVALLPARTPLAVVFVAGAAQSLAAGLTLGNVRLLQLAPPLIFGAWATFATESLMGDIQWISTPFALALLAVVELGRWDRRRQGLENTTDELRLAEIMGMAIMAGPALYQTIAASTAYGLVAILQGVALVIWGAVSHVRRRVFGGAAASVLGASLMILVPLLSVIPEIRGVALWAVLLTVGAGLLATAATIEQMRRGVAGIRRSLQNAMEGWE